jgi:hypothetical protein
MSEISRVTQQNAELYRQTEIRKECDRMEERRIEENRMVAQHKHEEEKRIEMNRYMNRAGQNVDKMA